MPRRVVYGLGVWCTTAATVLTIISIALPRWIRWESEPEGERKFSYGLHRKCSTVTGTCDPFPSKLDCDADATFCALWRSVGFLMSFAVIIEFASWIAFAVVILGGVQQRSYGWKMVCPLLGLASLAQLLGMSIITYLFDHDERFFIGWKLDVSWILCTISWGLLALTATGIGAATYVLPGEGGYELLDNDYD